MLLPIVLGSAGIPFKCLNRETKKMEFIMLEKRIQPQASLTQHTQSTKPYISTVVPGKTKANLRNKGKDKRHIVSLSTPICP
jgi:hypothetical protein